MGNLRSGGGGGEGGEGYIRPIERAWYKYTTVDLCVLHFLSRFSSFRLLSTWAPMVAICLAITILGGVALVVVPSLLTLYLPQKGSNLVTTNANNGIKISTITNFSISISFFQGLMIIPTLFATDLGNGATHTINNYGSLAQQVSLYFL